MCLSSKRGLTNFSTFLDSFPKQVAYNITHYIDKVVDNTTVVVDVAMRIAQEKR